MKTVIGLISILFCSNVFAGVTVHSEQENETQQTDIVEKVTGEIKKDQQAWQSLREETYDQLNLDPQVREYLDQARSRLQDAFDAVAKNIGSKNEQLRLFGIRQLQQLEANYNHFAQTLLGAEKYLRIQSLRDQFNRNILGTRIGDAW